MKTFNQLYALITTQCNLSCPHCDVKNQKDNFNYEAFMEQIRNYEGNIILFGGEVSLYPNRIYDIYYSDPAIQKKIKTVSTNLVYLDEKLINFYKDIKMMATSWNRDRFSDKEYHQWLKNIDILSQYDIHLAILITITNDLMEMDIDEFIRMISTWNQDFIEYIHFEFFVGDYSTPEYFEKADEWLCEIYKRWTSKIPIRNVKKIEHFCNDCSNTYTLYPDGKMVNHCPHAVPKSVPEECLTCERANICRPCQLQKYCSYPKRFAELVAKDKELQSKDDKVNKLEEEVCL